MLARAITVRAFALLLGAGGLAAGGLLASCGPEGPLADITIRVNMEAACDGADPTTLRLSASWDEKEQVSVEGELGSGERLRLPTIPFGEGRLIEVQLLDADGLVVCEGKTDPFALSEEEPADVNIVVKPCSNTFHPDKDGDGHGDAKTSKPACASSMPGYVASGDDCADDNKDVFPGQTKFFATPFTKDGQPSFDYDCNGSEEQERTELPNCVGRSPSTCSKGDPLWAGGTVPQCGETKDLATCVKSGGSTCTEELASPPQQATQACH